jgi:hypothetical protein
MIENKVASPARFSDLSMQAFRSIINDGLQAVGPFVSSVGRISQILWITLCRTLGAWAANPRQIVKITNRSHFEQKKTVWNQRLVTKNQHFEP